MDGVFEHAKAVIDYAYLLVREYDDHQAEQDKLHGGDDEEKMEPFNG